MFEGFKMFSSLPFHLWWVKQTIPGHLKCTLAFCPKSHFFLLLFSFITILNYFCILIASFSNHSLSCFLWLLPYNKSQASLLTRILPWIIPSKQLQVCDSPSSLPCSPSPSDLLKTPTFHRVGTLHLCLQKFSLSIWPTF